MRQNRNSATILTLSILLLVARGVFAQADLTKHVVFTDKAAYVAGVPQEISGSDASVYPDPRGRYALVSYAQAASRAEKFVGSIPSDPAASSLLLYDAHTGRTKTLWRGGSIGKAGTVGEVSWLVGSDAALCVLFETPFPAPAKDAPEQMTSILMLVRPGTDGLVSREVCRSDAFLMVHPSPILATVVVQEMRAVLRQTIPVPFLYRYFTIDDHGNVGGDIPVSPKTRGALQWSPDGATAYFFDLVTLPSDTDPANGANPPVPRQKLSWCAFDLQTRQVTQLPSRPTKMTTWPPKTGDANPLRLVSGLAAAAPPGEPQAAATPSRTAQLAPLWLSRTDRKTEGHLPATTLVAPDAEQSYLLADDSAVLYLADRSVYAVPLTREPRPDIDLAYRKLLQQKALSNAKQLGLALIGYTQDNNERFPDNGGNLAQTLAAYIRDPTLFNNPETDTPGFTLMLPGQSQTNIADAAHTVLGYLAGPGGRVALMADGHTHWEDNP